MPRRARFVGHGRPEPAPDRRDALFPGDPLFHLHMIERSARTLQRKVRAAVRAYRQAQSADTRPPVARIAGPAVAGDLPESVFAAVGAAWRRAAVTAECDRLADEVAGLHHAARRDRVGPANATT